MKIKVYKYFAKYISPTKINLIIIARIGRLFIVKKINYSRKGKDFEKI